jgi:hypothetical protein
MTTLDMALHPGTKQIQGPNLMANFTKRQNRKEVMKMQYKYKYLTMVICLIVVSIIGVSMLSAQDAEAGNLVFVNHILMGLAEQDVYLVNEDGTVERIPGDVPLASIGQPLYASSEAQEHDPFALGDTPIGPFPMGAELGVTLGSWLKAGGSGSYAVDGDASQIELSLNNLVPGGVYTVWCSVVTLPPEHTITDTPCGAADGSENSFTADEHGNATFSATSFVLPPTTDTSLSMVALAYHSDGHTYGTSPGDFGLNSHVQIIAVVPAME